MEQRETAPYNVLFVSDAFWPYIGGAENFAFTILPQLAEQGLEISVLTHRFHGTKPHESVKNLKIYRERLFFLEQDFNLFRRIIFYLRSAQVIMKHVLEKRPNVILAQQLISIPALLVSKFFRVPIIVIVHDYWPICYYRSLLKPNGKLCFSFDNFFHEIHKCAKNSICRHSETPRFLGLLFAVPYAIFLSIHTLIAKSLLKTTNTVIAVSHFLKKVLVANRFDTRKIRVIYNPIILKNKIERPACIQASPPTILYVGRLEFEKGVEFLLRAIPEVLMKVGEVELAIVGDGPLRTQLQLLARKLQIEYLVKFMGRVSEDLLMRLYQSCSVVVVPSIWAEPFGRVVAEAIMHKRPVVASDIGAVPELVSGKSGVLVPPRDVRAIADALISVIEKKAEYEFNPLITRKFSQDIVVSKVLDIINSILEPH